MVNTQGISMELRVSQGDLVLVWDWASYHAGDSAAFWSDQLDTVVLHRIVAIEDGR